MSELSHYRYIDALRGIAFLGVLTCHVGLLLKPTFPGYDVFMMGARGVQLFYLLSAATLLRSFSLRGAQERFPIRNFFVRRLFRIAPLFWFAMALYYWQMGARPRYWAPNGLQTWHFVTTALFLNGWTLTSINSVVLNGWSVAIEMTFYLMLPFLAKRITTIWGGITATLCATSIAIILDRALMPILTQTTPQNEQVLIPFFIYSWFPSQLPVFLLGFVLYSCLQNETVMKMLAGSERPAWLVIAAVVGCLGLASVPKEAGWEIPLHVYDAIALMFLVLAVHIRPFAWIVNLFTCRIGVI
ncbi:MAG TPA: acyltransferase family protein, partial [Candidatus Methylacidiphilales bacterium]|nr:acyltransferase family protein [Candidatus Methylacidiphilales bacterium]